MFLLELHRLATKLGMSNGELLLIARRITESDTLRPIDRLTRQEREQLLAELREMAELDCAPV